MQLQKGKVGKSTSSVELGRSGITLMGIAGRLDSKREKGPQKRLPKSFPLAVPPPSKEHHSATPVVQLCRKIVFCVVVAPTGKDLPVQLRWASRGGC